MRPITHRTYRLSGISAARKTLVRTWQWMDYGVMSDLLVHEREPVFDPPPTLLLDVKLDSESGGRPESELADFVLCDEVCRLLDRLDQIHTGRIQRIEVRAGIPRRILIEAKLTEAPR